MGNLDITIEEREAINQFRPIAREITGNEIKIDDEFLLRWLRARNLSVDKAEQMLEASMEWRTKVGIKNILNFQAPEIVKQDFTFKFVGEDSEGRPIVVVPYGRWDVRQKVELGFKEEALQYCRRLLELIMIEITKRKRNGVTQFVAILDSEGMTFRKIAHLETMNTALQFFKEFEANYPEILHTCYIVNAPWIFPYAFNLVKPLLSMRTLGKVEIYDGSNEGSKWRAILTSRLPVAALPSDYGGSGQPYVSNDA